MNTNFPGPSYVEQSNKEQHPNNCKLQEFHTFRSIGYYLAQNGGVHIQSGQRHLTGSYYRLLSTVWLDLFESDPATALRLGLHLEPKDTISIDLPEFENVAECVPYVIKAIAGAQIAPEDGNQLLNAMWSGSKLQKLDELEKQVEQLMEFKNGNN